MQGHYYRAMTTINNPHDKYFRASMSDLRVAKEFMEQHLPKNALKMVDLSTLTPQKESFVDASLKLAISDMLYKVKIKNGEGYIYLLAEHQSTPDRFMAFRLLRYVCNIMAHHVEDKKEKTLPIVFPLVFYHGRRRYPYSTDIFDLFGSFKEVAKNVLLKPFHLIDVNNISDEVLKEKVWSGILTFMQKHIYERDLLKYMEEIMPLLEQVFVTSQGKNYIISTLHYAVNAGSIEDVKQLVALFEKLAPDLGGDIMTLAERLKEKGRTEGVLKGLKEGVLQGMAEGLAEGTARGLAEGKAKGLAEGTARGLAAGTEKGFAAALEAFKLLAEGVTVEEVCRITGLSQEVVGSLVAVTKKEKA